MSNLNKWYKTEKEQTDLRVISFVSRPKDNIEVEDFSSRKTSFVSTMTDEELVPIFEAWAKQGKKNEFSRMYVSLNKRNHKTVQHSLMHYLLDHQELNLGSLDSRIAMIAAQPEHALESKYFYDFDADAEQLKEFLSDLAKAYEETKQFNDGDSDFEKKIAELNIRSNNAGVVKIYSLGIDRKKTENGFEDTLNLIIPPSKSDEENKQALVLYKKKYHSEETA